MIDGRSVRPVHRDTDEGLERLCRCCDHWWPVEPAHDADGRLVRFWHQRAICSACLYEMHNERERRKRRAA